MSTSTLFQLMVEKGKALDSKNILFMSDLFAWALCGNRTVDRTIASTSQLVKDYSQIRKADHVSPSKQQPVQ